jgi:hypothetical protein
MFLSKGVAGFPKLINLVSIVGQDITPTTFERGFGVADFVYMSNGLRAYNYKWYVQAVPLTDAGGAQYDTAYQRLFEIDDPQATTVKTRKVTISITADCDLLRGLSVDKYITLPEGQVEIQEITYDTNNNSLTISGLI